MYRQYENPNELKEYLEDLKTAYLIMSAESENWVFYDGRWEALSDLLNEIADIEERINFAYQDEEAEEYGYDY